MATAVGLGAALLIGLPALRVHGLFLAVITLAFSVAAADWLSTRAVFTGSEFATTTPFMEPPVIGGIDFGDRRSFYFLCLACLGLMTAVMARVRRTGPRPLDDRRERERGHGGGLHRSRPPA